MRNRGYSSSKPASQLRPPPRTKGPGGAGRSNRPSSLLPSDLDDFELAAEQRESGDLSAPYDPEMEERVTMRQNRPSRARPTKGRTRELSAVLFGVDRFRYKVFVKHIKWARKRALKAGIAPGEVDLWEV